MKDKSYWVSSGSYTMLHRGIDFILGFLGFMMLVRILTQEEFGTWVLLITLISIVEVARNGFLQNAMIKLLVAHKESGKNIQSTALFLNLLLTLIIMVVLWVAAPWFESVLNAPELADIIRIFVLLLPVLVLHTHNLILMQAKFDFRAYFWAGISKSVPFFLFIGFYFIRGWEIELVQVAWLFVISYAGASVVSLYQVRKYLEIGMNVSIEWILRIFHFGKYVFGTNLVSMLSNSMDKFLLGALLSPVQVALANTAGKVMNLIHIPINSIASISYPKASEAHEKETSSEVGRMFEQTTGMMLAVTLPFLVFVVLFPEQIILFIAGEKYINAAPFLLIVSMLSVLYPFDRQFGVFLDAIDKPHLNMIMVFINFALVIILTWLLINAMGLLGAAWALVISVAITTVLKYFFLRRFISFRSYQPFIEAIWVWGKGLRYVTSLVKSHK